MDLCDRPLRIYNINPNGDNPYLFDGALYMNYSSGVTINGIFGDDFPDLASRSDMISRLFNLRLYTENNDRAIYQAIDTKQDKLLCSPCDSLDAWRPRLDSLEETLPCNPCDSTQGGNKTFTGAVRFAGTGFNVVGTKTRFASNYVSTPDSAVVVGSPTDKAGMQIYGGALS